MASSSSQCLKRVHDQSNDWRSSLFSVFVDNLNRRFSKVALWEAFCAYGRVVDVYISFRNKRSLSSPTFAFVRFKDESEMVKAIERGNNRKIDGRFIVVKKAAVGWNEKNKKAVKQGNAMKSALLPSKRSSFRTCRDRRSYRDVLMGKAQAVNGKTPKEVVLGHNHGNVTGLDGPSKEDGKAVIFNMEIPKSDMEWLSRSVVGCMHDGVRF